MREATETTSAIADATMYRFYADGARVWAIQARLAEERGDHDGAWQAWERSEECQRASEEF